MTPLANLIHRARLQSIPASGKPNLVCFFSFDIKCNPPAHNHDEDKNEEQCIQAVRYASKPTVLSFRYTVNVVNDRQPSLCEGREEPVHPRRVHEGAHMSAECLPQHLDALWQAKS
ncbi:hypothetical protein MRX96_041872 [Rhipicephalus microplus]